MQIVKSEGKYRVYGENIEVYDKFEPDFYQFMVDDNGPFIVRTNRPSINFKVYGVDQKKVDKCFNTYEKFNRSLGIMLVGDKGNGKTLFAKQMCIKMIEAGYPVINVNFYHPSLPTFMTQLSQECVFLFDEFEKMFEHDERRGSAQNEMLSTFDGINMTKKMFIITCNDIDKLSEYIYNRPGRFHYSFTFSEPSYTDIDNYLNDNINTKTCIEKVDDITLFSYINGLNYDCLRSLVFELNNGYSLVETFDDLNIGYKESKYGDISLVFTNNEVLTGNFGFEPFSTNVIMCDLHTKRSWYCVGTLRFHISDLKYDAEKDLYVLPEDINIEWTNISTVDKNDCKEAIMYYRSLTPLYLNVNIHKKAKVNPLRQVDYNSLYDPNEGEPCGIEVDDGETHQIHKASSPFKNVEKCLTPGIGFHIGQ